MPHDYKIYLNGKLIFKIFIKKHIEDLDMLVLKDNYNFTFLLKMSDLFWVS